MSADAKALLYVPSSNTELAVALLSRTLKPCFMSLSDRMKLALERAKLTPAEIARRLDVTPQAVNGWFTTGRISKQKLADFAREVGADIGELIDGEEHVVRERPPMFSRSGAPQTREVPVVGFAIATPDSDGYFDDMDFPAGAGDDYLAWQTKDKNAYALRVKGDSMQSRIRPGELIVVEPNTAVHPGDDVIVRTKSGRKMVKQLLLRRGDDVTLGSINQEHKQLTLSMEEIESIHFIAAIVPRGSSVKG